MQENVTRASTAMLILPCPVCGRSVKVLGRVRRVLCACGEVLMDSAGRDSRDGSSAPAAGSPTRRALKAG